MMGELSARTEVDWESFGRRWLPTLVAVLVRTVHDPAVAFDLATETLAAAVTEWERPATGEQGVADVIGLAAGILGRAVDRHRVPTTERRRHGFAPHGLTVDQQRELMALAEHVLDLPPTAHEAAEALARSAPGPPALRELRCSELVDAERFPDHERKPDGA